MDQFEQAANANRWQGDARKIAIAMGYLKGAASDWAQAATVNGAANQITHWNNGNAATDFRDRFLAKFAPETKQNKWYYELMTIRQMAEETVDAYTLRFQRLLRKVNVNQLVPAVLQVRMYLYGLSPLLTPLVATANPADLAAAIERARIVETGYNYIPTKEMTIAVPPAVKVPKATIGSSPAPVTLTVDELTQKLDQLSLNYAILMSAFTTTQGNQGGNNRSTPRRITQQSYTSRRNNTERTCFNCEQAGHFIRDCPLPRKQNQNQPRRARFSNNTRDLNYVELFDEEEYYTEEEEYEDDEYEYYHYEREAYPAERRGREYSTRSKVLHPKKIDELEEMNELRRNTAQNARTTLGPEIPEAEMEDVSDSEEEIPAPIPKKVTTKAKPTTTKKSPKYKMLPAPIESLTEFNVSNYLQNLPCGLTVGQAAHLLPRYRSGMQKAMRRSRDKLTREANFVGTDSEATTAAKCTIRIAGQAQTAIVDSGAATSIITKNLLARIGYSIDRPSKIIVVTANGARTKSLGVAEEIPVQIGKIKINTSFQVLESKDDVLILGNDWLRGVAAELS